MKLPLECTKFAGTRFTVLALEQGMATGVNHSNLKIERIGINELTVLSEDKYESLRCNETKTSKAETQ